MRRWNKIKKKNTFPEVGKDRKVAIAALLAKGMPTVMFRVGKYSRGWGTTYKSFEEALAKRPSVSLWR